MSALFPDLSAAAAALREERLLQVISTWAPGVVLSDDYLAEKLRTAEADAERKLRVFFSPVEIIPTGWPEDTAALDAAGIRWVEEPGYDFEPELFAGERWGLLETRHRPIVRIDAIQFTWPAPALGVLYRIPKSWPRVDKKYGRINLVPTQDMVSLPLNTFLLTTLGGGRRIPLMVQIRYCAGLDNTSQHWPDLLDLVKKMAILSLMGDWFLPTSGSISADGLSQSKGLDIDKFASMVEGKLDALRQALHGLRVMVV